MTSELPDRPLDRDDVVTAIRPLLPLIERLGDRVLLVGTASSCLRGISLPVADVDILARERPVVDELAHALAEAGARRVSGPVWLTNPAFGQYFGEYEMAGVRVEVSTVEIAPGDAVPIGECTGDEPWANVDVVRVEGHWVPVVASELRLLSEVARDRPERWKPIAARLASDGYRDELLATALASLPADRQSLMRDAVRPPGGA